MTITIQMAFGDIADELQRKAVSLVSEPDAAERELVAVAEPRLSPEEMRRVRATLEFISGLRSAEPAHPSLRAYLSHPIRVARMAFAMRGPASVDVLLTGLLHNVYEVAGLSEHDLTGRGYDSRTARAVRLLTIDRSRETDTGYLAAFYGEIERFDADLSLVRCIDKLDNLLAMELIEDAAVKASYLDLAEQFVAPMAARLSPDFGNYFQQVVALMRARPFQPSLRTAYDRFVAGHLEVSS